jgi:hypothetical protein
MDEEESSARQRMDRYSSAGVISFDEMDKIKYYSSGFVLYTATSFVANPFLQIKRRVQMAIHPTHAIDIYKASGIQGLFRGGSLSWVSGSNRMMYFTVYEYAYNILEKNTMPFLKKLNLSTNSTNSIWAASSAAVASIISQGTLTPLHVVTTRLHVNEGPPVSAIFVVKSIISKYGRWSVLWTGNSYQWYI